MLLPIVRHPARAGVVLDFLTPALCLLLLVVGMGATPELLERLGPMRASLQSPYAAVQRIAHIEIGIIRAACLALGLSIGALWFAWPRLQRASWLRRITLDPPALPMASWSRATILRLPLLLILSCIAACLAFVLLAPSRLSPAAFAAIVDEDGLIEQATAGLFLVAAIVALTAANRWPTLRHRTTLALMAVGFLACVGEEISWGQRLLDFATPQALGDINVQGEANLHNSFGYAADHLFIAGVLLLGFVLPASAARFRTVHRAADRLGLPVASPSLAVGFLLVSMLHGWTIYRLVPPTGLRIAEPRELISALGFVILMAEACLAAGRVRVAPRPAGGAAAAALGGS